MVKKPKSEIRQNILTGDWVIYAPHRGTRPIDHKKTKAKSKVPKHEKSCPFCTGNEEMLPGIIYEEKVGKKWQTRVVPNKYPALFPEASNKVKEGSLFSSGEGSGYQEVIVETSIHNKNFADITEKEMEVVVNTYHSRYVELLKNKKNKTVLIFRNHGEKAGTSRIHPHSQVFALGFVPEFMTKKEKVAKSYYLKKKKNIYSEILKNELKTRKRIILQNKDFVAFVPYFAEVPYEIWIMPRKRKASFSSLTSSEQKSFSVALKKCLSKLSSNAGNPSYNFIIHTASKGKENAKHLSWYLQIRPRFGIPAGFEIATNMQINPGFPEDYAKTLRK